MTGAAPAGRVAGAAVVAAARSFIGCRYRHQGRSRADGVDCIGLAVCVRAALGLLPMDADSYPRRTTDAAMLAYCRRHMREVARADLTPGDVLVQMAGALRHMAIAGDYPGGGLSIIHAWAPNRQVAECRLDDAFLRDVRGCFRFPEVAP